MNKDLSIEDGYQKIALNKIRPNNYNNNQMKSTLFTILKNNIQAQGFNQPILVKKEQGKDLYVIVDGEHRYRAVKELGYKEIPCKVLPEDFDEKKIKLATISMNNIKGEADWRKTAELFKEFTETYDLESRDISAVTGYEDIEIKVMLNNIQEELDGYSDKLNKNFFDVKKAKKKVRSKQSKNKGKYQAGKVVKYKEAVKLGKHKLILGLPKSVDMIDPFIPANKSISLFFYRVPVEDIKVKHNIHLWSQDIYRTVHNYISETGSYIIGTPLIVHDSIISMYDFATVKFLQDKFGYKYANKILSIGDYMSLKDYRHGYTEYHHLIQGDYRYVPVTSIKSYQNPSSTLLSKDILKSNSAKTLPLNLFIDSDEISQCFQRAIMLSYTDNNDVIVEAGVSNAKMLLSCESDNRQYIGYTTNKAVFDACIDLWELYTDKDSKIIKE